jgi:exodeoxyribonuclease-3
VSSILFPQEDAFNSLQDKLSFQQEFLSYLKKTRNKRREFIICGNYQVAHKTVDLSDWEQHQEEPGFLPVERAWFDQLVGPAQYVDAFREANFGENQFTWWPNQEAKKRNKGGRRIDYQLCTPNLRQYIVDAKIDRSCLFGAHAPVVIEYEIEDVDKF